jgi:hypothetical protein
MSIKYLREFLDNIDGSWHPYEIDKEALERLKQLIQGADYFEFLSAVTNGGLFFSKSLQLYSCNTAKDYTDIEFVNNVLKAAFDYLFNGLYAFGQDVFGNQFAYEQMTKQVVFFNCETGEKKVLARNFKEWLDCLFNDLDYYAGISFVEDWNEKNVLLPNQRLCPIKPFVIGGDYERKNFYALDFPKYIEYSADIAKQIFNLKDGQKVKLVIKNWPPTS